MSCQGCIYLDNENYVSIPKGAIMSFEKTIKMKQAFVSIPKGAIMRVAGSSIINRTFAFQFQKVRL